MEETGAMLWANAVPRGAACRPWRSC